MRCRGVLQRLSSPKVTALPKGAPEVPKAAEGDAPVEARRGVASTPKGGCATPELLAGRGPHAVAGRCCEGGGPRWCQADGGDCVGDACREAAV